MAYWVHESGNKNSALWKSYMCDYITDIENLPTTKKEGLPQTDDSVSKNRCAPGSRCFCQEDGSVWLLGKDTDTWKKQKNSSGGSSGGGITADEIEPIPYDSIESLFL